MSEDSGARRLRMSQSEFVGFLASVSATTALGIDMVLPAFGDVRQAFGLADDSTQVALTVTIYFLGLSFAQIIYGPLTDRFGRKPILLAGLSLYVAAAVLAGLAPNLPLLLLARLLWGIGAAGPRVLVLAIARDAYEGDTLGRVLSLAQAIFMIVPAVAPLLGQAVLTLGDWRLVFVAPALPALILMLWSTRLDETLDPADRRPLTFDQTTTAFRAVVGHRAAFGFSLALMFDFAAFASFLSSSEALFDRVYDRSSQFPVFFGLMSAVMGVTAFAGSRVIGRFGARPMITALVKGQLVLTALLLLVSILGDGSPAFLMWFGLLSAANALRTLLNPLSGSEAMQSMGDLAGTAASVMGLISLGGGALLSSITDRFIGSSVTPLSIAYVLFAVLQFLAVRWATGRLGPSRQSSPQVLPDPV